MLFTHVRLIKIDLIFSKCDWKYGGMFESICVIMILGLIVEQIIETCAYRVAIYKPFSVG